MRNSALILVIAAATAAFACGGSDNEDDSGGGGAGNGQGGASAGGSSSGGASGSSGGGNSRVLCLNTTNCPVDSACPPTPPEVGGNCSEMLQCYYCRGAEAAFGYDCDGSTWIEGGSTIVCEPPP